MKNRGRSGSGYLEYRPVYYLLCFGKYESPVQTVMIIDNSLNFRSLLLTIIFAFKRFMIVGNERRGTKGLSHFTC